MLEPIKKEINTSTYPLYLVVGALIGGLIYKAIPTTYDRSMQFSEITASCSPMLILVGIYLHEQNNKYVEYTGLIMVRLAIIVATTSIPYAILTREI